MTFPPICVAILLATLGISTPANAFGGHFEFMEYVTDFDAAAVLTDDEDVSLCHLIKERHFVFIPVWFQSRGYVLAPNHCDSDRYRELTPEAFAAFQAAGVIPAKLPASPSLSFQQQMALAPWVLFFLAGLGIKVFRDRRPPPSPIVADLLPFLQVACFAALAKGSADEEDIETIAAVVYSVTRTRFEPALIRQVVASCHSNPSPQGLAVLLGRPDPQKNEILMRVALIVSVTDEDRPADSVLRFLDSLATTLSISPARYESILREMRAALVTIPEAGSVSNAPGG